MCYFEISFHIILYIFLQPYIKLIVNIGSLESCKDWLVMKGCITNNNCQYLELIANFITISINSCDFTDFVIGHNFFYCHSGKSLKLNEGIN
jgi:hypothetical protein